MKTLNFMDMAQINGGSQYFNGCDVALNLAGGVWGFAIGAATGLVGALVFGLAVAAVNSYLCHSKDSQ